MWRWYHDPQVGRWMGGDPPISLAQNIEKGQSRPRNTFEQMALGIETLDGQKLIGYVALGETDFVHLFLGEHLLGQRTTSTCRTGRNRNERSGSDHPVVKCCCYPRPGDTSLEISSLLPGPRVRGRTCRSWSG
ncbi:hypothetical protein ABZ260_02110 [Streptosporangium sp. NPDC006013]|uniref:hypothetical protein n=1 Tax=Streptosporangium sp. NPDC006013 TaxID=3155596 RepID=UPI0033A9A559